MAAGTYAIRRLSATELAACQPLAMQRLGFSERDLIPAWLMHTTNASGGLTIGAFAGERLIGFSYGLPGFDGRPFLLSCGLAVDEIHQGRGVGEALKRAQAQEARRAGYAVIRWTTGSLASRPLRLYLSKLGARLVRLREDLYGDVRPVLLSDEVEIEWDLVRGTRPSPSVETAGRRVEIPWKRDELVQGPREDAERWVRRVRAEMKRLLADGHVGTAVVLDRDSRRSFVVFEPA